MVIDRNHILEILKEVSDPEIPVLTIEDLGILRNAIVDDNGNVTVQITPTYTGCPAMDMIESMVKEKLSAFGALNVLVTLVYKPAWTTDWMNAQTKEKLRAFGIAPPVGKVLSKKSLLANETVACPQCRSENTKIKSMFGSTACKALYTCSDCLEPFDYFKCI